MKKESETTEDPAAKLDRETVELLQGLRVIQPGVAVLFAFLLTLPFTEKFGEIDRNERSVYFVAFLTATASLASLVAPGSLYRVRWRKRDKEFLLRVGNRFALAGTAFLAVAIACSVFIVTDLLYKGVAPFVAAGTAVILGTIWFGLGLVRHDDND
jgi:hypothetical protein